MMSAPSSTDNNKPPSMLRPSAAEGFPRPFGPYVLLRPFAQGGMGEVFLAKSGGYKGIDRLCVIKKLRPDATLNADYLGRFIDEARVAVQLSHSGIAHVFDVGSVAGEPYLAMEYVAGSNLREVFSRFSAEGGKLPAPLALWVVGRALEALDYAHRRRDANTARPLNLVHRDISPQNIMLSYEGEVKLIDFGLAHSELKTEQTESQVVMGKVAYMSPEQARGDAVDSRTDLFAIGVVLYELLTGERFYGEMNNYQIWQVVGRGGFVPGRFTELEQDLTAILQKALAADKDARYAAAADFQKAVEAALRNRAPTFGQSDARAFMNERYEHEEEQERAMIAALVSARVAVAIGGAPLETFARDVENPSLPPAVAEAPIAPLGVYDATEATPLSGVRPRATAAAALGEETEVIRPERAAASAATGTVDDDTSALVRAAYRPERASMRVVAPALALLLFMGAGAFVVWQRAGKSDSSAVVEVAPAEKAKAASTSEPPDTPAVREPPVVDPADVPSDVDAEVEAKAVVAAASSPPAPPVDEAPTAAPPAPTTAAPVAAVSPPRPAAAISAVVASPAAAAAARVQGTPVSLRAQIQRARARGAKLDRKTAVRLFEQCRLPCASLYAEGFKKNLDAPIDNKAFASVNRCLDRCAVGE